MKVNLLLFILLFNAGTLQCFSQKITDEKLVNDPSWIEEFMDWDLGIFIHWSIDSQPGSVISHSIVGASDDYLRRYLNALPASFYPVKYDPDRWQDLHDWQVLYILSL